MCLPVYLFHNACFSLREGCVAPELVVDELHLDLDAALGLLPVGGGGRAGDLAAAGPGPGRVLGVVLGPEVAGDQRLLVRAVLVAALGLLHQVQTSPCNSYIYNVQYGFLQF